MSCNLKVYGKLADKAENFRVNEIINTEKEFEAKLIQLDEYPKVYAFRGVSEAKYMMYTSAQRALICNNHIRDYTAYIRDFIQRARRSDLLNNYFNSNKIPITDFLILGLLQHYGKPSPMLDFSYDLKIALFFAFDNVLCGKSGIDDYVSIYRVQYKDNPYIGSIQEMESYAMRNLNKYIKDAKQNIEDWLSSLRKTDVFIDFKKLPYEKYKDIEFAFILGGDEGEIEIRSVLLNFYCFYKITNPRMNSQNALFMLNNKREEPLETIVKQRCTATQRGVIECYNINKGLRDYIQEKYLNDIKREDIYPNDEDSRQIQNELDKLFP